MDHLYMGHHLGCVLMLNELSRMRSGDMEAELSARVDGLIDEFMAQVNIITEERHLQKGIARSQLPCSMVAILDKNNLSLLGQFRLENRVASYFHRPDIAITYQQAANSAQWEFGFEDPFIIQLPAALLEQSAQDRRAALVTAASKHIDSEYQRLVQMLSLMRTRPIFGPATEPVGVKTLLLLLAQDEKLRGNDNAIISSVIANGLPYELAPDIRSGRSAVREMWHLLNRAAVIAADLTGADPAVMYALGIAHTLGKETILICPQGSKYLTDIPRTYRIEYQDSEAGRNRLQEELSLMLGTLLKPVVDE
jgi:hypothetical protein